MLPREPSENSPMKGKGVLWVAVFVLLAGGMVAFRFLNRSPSSTISSSTARVVEVEPRPVSESDASRLDSISLRQLPTPARSPAVQSPAPVAPASASRPSPAELVESLAQLGGAEGPITAEQAGRFKQTLAELVGRGASSVPAIREYLGKNLDTAYSEISGGDQLGYSSLRAGLIDALKQIGGPEGQAAMAQVMQTTAVPAELLALAGNLEQQAPGEYREQILNGAQEALNMASANQLGTNVEVGPAFRMLQTYWNANTTADAANNDPLQFYNAVTLANLPDGAGLNSLIQMAQNPGAGSQTIATEMIAQLAGQNSQALDTLAQMAQNGQITQDIWVKLAPILGGGQYQIGGSSGAQLSAGGQNYALVDSATSPDQINQRIALIDKFLGFVPDDSAAAAALQRQRSVLAGKLGGSTQPN